MPLPTQSAETHCGGLLPDLCPSVSQETQGAHARRPLATGTYFTSQSKCIPATENSAICRHQATLPDA
jgi:hypothetical protein